jgi:hypothetical protein
MPRLRGRAFPLIPIEKLAVSFLPLNEDSIIWIIDPKERLTTKNNRREKMLTKTSMMMMQVRRMRMMQTMKIL